MPEDRTKAPDSLWQRLINFAFIRPFRFLTTPFRELFALLRRTFGSQAEVIIPKAEEQDSAQSVEKTDDPALESISQISTTDEESEIKALKARRQKEVAEEMAPLNKVDDDGLTVFEKQAGELEKATRRILINRQVLYPEDIKGEGQPKGGGKSGSAAYERASDGRMVQIKKLREGLFDKSQVFGWGKKIIDPAFNLLDPFVMNITELLQAPYIQFSTVLSANIAPVKTELDILSGAVASEWVGGDNMTMQDFQDRLEVEQINRQSSDGLDAEPNFSNNVGDLKSCGVGPGVLFRFFLHGDHDFHDANIIIGKDGNDQYRSYMIDFGMAGNTAYESAAVALQLFQHLKRINFPARYDVPLIQELVAIPLDVAIATLSSQVARFCQDGELDNELNAVAIYDLSIRGLDNVSRAVGYSGGVQTVDEKRANKLFGNFPSSANLDSEDKRILQFLSEELRAARSKDSKDRLQEKINPELRRNRKSLLSLAELLDNGDRASDKYKKLSKAMFLWGQVDCKLKEIRHQYPPLEIDELFNLNFDALCKLQRGTYSGIAISPMNIKIFDAIRGSHNSSNQYKALCSAKDNDIERLKFYLAIRKIVDPNFVAVLKDATKCMVYEKESSPKGKVSPNRYQQLVESSLNWHQAAAEADCRCGFKVSSLAATQRNNILCNVFNTKMEVTPVLQDLSKAEGLPSTFNAGCWIDNPNYFNKYVKPAAELRLGPTQNMLKLIAQAQWEDLLSEVGPTVTNATATTQEDLQAKRR